VDHTGLGEQWQATVFERRPQTLIHENLQIKFKPMIGLKVSRASSMASATFASDSGYDTSTLQSPRAQFIKAR
jgi:hypothetical protein